MPLKSQKINVLKEVIGKTIEAVCQVRLENEFQAFTDERFILIKWPRKTYGTRHFISTCEGLETIFMPCTYIADFQLRELFEKHKGLKDAIGEDIAYLARHMLQSKPDFNGGPYFFTQSRRKGGYKNIPINHFESAAFAVSVFVHLRKIMLDENIRIDNFRKSKLDNLIDIGLRYLIENCSDEGGWGWNDKNKQPHIYSTWTVLETIDEIKEFDNERFKKIQETGCLERTREWLINKYYRTKGFAKRWPALLKELPDEDKDPQEYQEACEQHYEAIYAYISLIILNGSSAQYILEDLDLLLQCHEIFLNESVYTKYRIVGRELWDESIVPLYLRGLSYICSKSKEIELKATMLPELRDSGGEQISKTFDTLLEKKLIRQEVARRKLKKDKNPFYHYFDFDGKKGEIYYTERVMEALVTYYSYLQEVEKGSKKSLGLQSTSPKDLGFARLPILDEIARNIKETKGEIFKDKILIFVLHLLNDLPPLVEEFNKLGCNYSDMYFLVKTYTYPERQRLQDYFRKQQSKVYLPEDSKQKTFEELCEKIVRESLRKSETENKDIVIVEDGGYFAPLLHNRKYEEETKKCIGAVEQTTKGYRRDLDIANYKFPIISVATSKLKLYLEAPEVGETLQENVITVLKTIGGKAINATKALILGIGTIGKELAIALNNKRVLVHVFDICNTKRMEAEQSREFYRDKVLENLEDLSKFDIIIGTSGETSLKRGENFWTLKPNVILASGSSERLEFNLQALEDQSESVERNGNVTEYTLEKDRKIVRLLCDGEPINFALSGGISNAVIDPVYAELFLGAVELVTKQLENKMHEIPRELEEEVYRLYRKYHSS